MNADDLFHGTRVCKFCGRAFDLDTDQDVDLSEFEKNELEKDLDNWSSCENCNSDYEMFDDIHF